MKKTEQRHVSGLPPPHAVFCLAALFNPETSILIQKRHPYTGNLNLETPGDSKDAFLYWGDVTLSPVLTSLLAEEVAFVLAHGRLAGTSFGSGNYDVDDACFMVILL